MTSFITLNNTFAIILVVVVVVVGVLVVVVNLFHGSAQVFTFPQTNANSSTQTVDLFALFANTYVIYIYLRLYMMNL